MKVLSSSYMDGDVMDPSDNTESDRQEQGSGVVVSHTEMHHLWAPLTVLSGHLQLLQRRIRRGQIPDNDDLLQRLGHIQKAVRAIETQLNALRDKADSDKKGPDLG